MKPIRNRTHPGVALSIVAILGGITMQANTPHAQTAPSSGATDAIRPADPEQIVDALKAVVGNPPKVRATFAKGQCVRGTYTPSERVSDITRSLSFTQPSSVVGRFSVGGGNPKVADTNNAVLRGFSFKLGNEGHMSDLLVESAPVHFARNLDQMLAFLKARIPGPDGKPDVEKVKAFTAANPETAHQAQFIAARHLPGSFAGVTYWGVHSFPATNASGQTRFIKFKVVPASGAEITLTEDEAKAKPADFLVQDLERRLADGAIRFNILAILDRPGDPTMDVTTRWPDEDARETVQLGTVAITRLENNETCDRTIFNPGNLADGIAHPRDEIFHARLTAYAISLAKRQ